MLQLWIVAIIVTTSGWPWTAYLHLGFFLLWHINTEEEAGSSPAFHHTLIFGETGCGNHTRIGQDKQLCCQHRGRRQEGAAGYLSFPASAAAAIFFSCCPVALCLHELEQAALGFLLFNSHSRVLPPPCPTALKWVCQKQLKSGWQETLKLSVQKSIFFPSPWRCWTLWTPCCKLHFSKLRFSEVSKKYMHTPENICSAEKQGLKQILQEINCSYLIRPSVLGDPIVIRY